MMHHLDPNTVSRGSIIGFIIPVDDNQSTTSNDHTQNDNTA